MFRPIALALFALGFVSQPLLCRAELFILAERAGFGPIVGDSADPDHQDWSDLRAFSLAFSSDSGPSSLATHFSMDADSTWPAYVEALDENTTLTLEMESVIDNQVIDHYLYENAKFTDLSIVYSGNGPARVTGVIAALRVHITHVPTNSETIWDNSSPIATGGAPLPGDFDVDGEVDLADYERWSGDFGATMALLGTGADGNADGRVDAADYTLWRDHYAGESPTDGNPIPEPSACFLLLGALGAVVCRR